MGVYTELWIPTVVICSVPFIITLLWIFVCNLSSVLNNRKRYLHLVPAVLSMLFYVASGALQLSDSISTHIALQVSAIYCWAAAEICIHLFFIVHIHEDFDDGQHGEDMKLQKKEKIILSVLIGLFFMLQIVIGITPILLHNGKISHVQAHWTDLCVNVISMIIDVAVCVYLLIIYGYRLGKINGSLAAKDTLTRYTLLLGFGTIYTFLGQLTYIIADGIHLHNQTKKFWTDELSGADIAAYFAWALDLMFNTWLIYLNIESGEKQYDCICRKPKGGCHSCVEKRAANQELAVALIDQ